MRKFLSVILALVMSLSLAVPAYAAEDSQDSGEAAPEVLNFRVPESISIRMNSDGEIQVADNLKISNLSEKSIQVSSIRVAGQNGWDVMDFDSDFDSMADEVKTMAMSFRGDGTMSDGYVDMTGGNWQIAGNAEIGLFVQAKMPKQSQCEASSIATVYYSIDWVNSEIEVLPVVPGYVIIEAGGNGSARVESVVISEDGKITFPYVYPDEGYMFDKWVDQDGNIVDENTVFEDGAVICPVCKPVIETPEPEPETIMISVLPGANGTADADEIQAGEDGRIVEFPDVTPDEGYMFDKWVDQDGNPVDSNTVFENGDAIRPVFVEIEKPVEIRPTTINRNAMDGLFGSNGNCVDSISFDLGKPEGATEIGNFADTVYATLDGAHGTIYLNNAYLVKASLLFKDYASLSDVDFSGLDSSNITSTNGMFTNCTGLVDLDMSDFDTSSVIDMSNMFLGCSNLESLDISGWDTSNVTDMDRMFDSCGSLRNFDAGELDTRNVGNMHAMFYGCANMDNIDVSGFDTRNVTNMSAMFQNCSGLTRLDVSGFDTRNVENMSLMFSGLTNLEDLDISMLDTGNVTDMSHMFENSSGLRGLDLSGLDVSSVRTMFCMFQGCSGLTSLDLSDFDTSRVFSMNAMFRNCSSLEYLDLIGFDTGNVMDMSNMFDGCSSLVELNLATWDVSNVTNTFAMWYAVRAMVTATPAVYDTLSGRDTVDNGVDWDIVGLVDEGEFEDPFGDDPFDEGDFEDPFGEFEQEFEQEFEKDSEEFEFVEDEEEFDISDEHEEIEEELASEPGDGSDADLVNFDGAEGFEEFGGEDAGFQYLDL